MPKFFGYDFRYVAAGENLDSAAPNPLTKEGVVSKIQTKNLPYVQSDGVNPAKIFQIGETAEIRAVFISENLGILKDVLNGILVQDSGNYIQYIKLSQQRGEKPLFDCRYYVKTDTDEEPWEYHYFTNMYAEGKIEFAFKQGEVWYLPVVFKSTKNTEFRIVHYFQPAQP